MPSLSKLKMSVLELRLIDVTAAVVLLSTPTSVSSEPSYGPCVVSWRIVVVPLALRMIRNSQPVSDPTAGHSLKGGVVAAVGPADADDPARMLKNEPARATEPKTTTSRRSIPPKVLDFLAVRDWARPDTAFADPDGIRFIGFLLCLSEESMAKSNSFVNRGFSRCQFVVISPI
jgi:hypothetical protein